MTKEAFTERKNELIDVIVHFLNIDNQDIVALNKILEILNQYSFENRLQKKGLLSHTIIDSLELDYAIGEKLIRFDESID